MANNLIGDEYKKFAKKALMFIGIVLFFIFGNLALQGGAEIYIIIYAVIAILGLIIFLISLIQTAFSSKNNK